MRGGDFDHRVYFSAGRQPSTSLHVYVEGDGRPWFRREQINLRPETPLPLMLRAMARDSSPALYLTRPCYNARVDQRNCGPWYWTEGRYAPRVVNSMAAALRRWVEAHPAQGISLYGHSGGGTLAMLLAARLPAVERVVTIAANLDTAAWTRHHGYSPLRGSLNPAARQLPASVSQFHYLGADDRNVPTGIFPFANAPPAIKVRVVAGQAHNCCWGEQWPGILDETDPATMRKAR